MKRDLQDLTPKEIVLELDRYIVGQLKAKKAVAIALRNRTRRQQLSDEMRDEVAPKNIIMIGPTGVGKTEIARRLSKLTGAPFIKVEATKYTEVGYVGRDVESMVRDLVSVAVSMVKTELQEEVKEEAELRTEDILLDLLLPGVGKSRSADKQAPSGEQGKQEPPLLAPHPADSDMDDTSTEERESRTREKFREKLRAGKLNDKEVEIQVTKNASPAIEIFSGTGFEEMDLNLGNLSGLFGGKKKKKRTTVERAREIILQEEMEKLVDADQLSELARRRAEQMGIIFIDEIDKIASKEGRSGGDVSREGVQRDILPIVEGSTVTTKHGMVDTSHILFIAAGAFHTSKPSDLIPELQGRFPLRVELEALEADDFLRILTQPKNALIRQYTELLATEGVTLDWHEDALQRLAEIAASVNSKTENIGARRLHTILELLLEDISFNAPDLSGQTIPITAEYVEERLGEVVQDQDLSRYIL
ncbi:MAG: ATP-dependent protease ATPase subunit HslU [Spirochaetaceae bacterium]|nr:MAG: ATP-dependent protease ATPase subunit HslU [Spirochaetaceae bacterium]